MALSAPPSPWSWQGVCSGRRPRQSFRKFCGALDFLACALILRTTGCVGVYWNGANSHPDWPLGGVHLPPMHTCALVEQHAKARPQAHTQHHPQAAAPRPAPAGRAGPHRLGRGSAGRKPFRFFAMASECMCHIGAACSQPWDHGGGHAC